MTDLATVDKLGLDKKQLADRVADSFLAQILKTSYFHCDPHPGNLQCDEKGNLVFFDCGMMNELSPNVAGKRVTRRIETVAPHGSVMAPPSASC